MKIRTKVQIGFALLLAIIIIFSVAGVRNLFNMSNQLNEIYEGRYNKVSLATELRSNTNNAAKYMVNVLTVPTAATVEKNRESIEKYRQAVLDGMAQIGAISTSDAEVQMMDELERDVTLFFGYVDEATSLVSMGKGSEAVALRESVGLAYQEAVVNKADQLSAYHKRALTQLVDQTRADNEATTSIMVALTIAGMLAGALIMVWNTRSLNRGFRGLSGIIEGFSQGTLTYEARRNLPVQEGEFKEVTDAFIALADDLDEKTHAEKVYNQNMQEQTWLKTNLANVTVETQSTTNLDELAGKLAELVAPLTGSTYAALYIRDHMGEGRTLSLRGSYAGMEETSMRSVIRMNEGLAGQAAADGKPLHLTDVPDHYLRVSSGIGEAHVRELYIVPIQYQNKVIGVLELATLQKFTGIHVELLEQVGESAGMVLHNLFGRIRIEELLRESQTMSEELQSQSEELISQQEELRSSNERLEEQTRALKSSEEMLQSQQEELEQTNEELLQKTHMLELQMKETQKRSKQIEETRDALEKQAVQLGLASKYKSEFLANMSHELRTPLNSLLILSQMLSDNKDGNLTAKQVEFATTIHTSGSDLLKLIDEILDLSKIGAGKMDVVTEHVPIRDLELYAQRSFQPVSIQKGLVFETKVDEGVPSEIFTDSHRVKQILRNLLSNAFKFTTKGSITLNIRKAADKEMPDNAEGEWVSFEVRDTGIGIPEDKQSIIFEAFQQVDGTTSRKYGGTGLGLAISRDLANLLGGSVRLTSKPGEGSSFVFTLPEFHLFKGEGESAEFDSQTGFSGMNEAAAAMVQPQQPALVEVPAAIRKPNSPSAMSSFEVEDDIKDLKEGDKVVLIVEDDEAFARVLVDIAHARGFKAIVAGQGDKGLSFARTYTPDAILLDIQLPVMDGWSVLHHLKNDPNTRHIPVHLISVIDEVQQGLSLGAIAYLKKPVSKDHLDDLFTQIGVFLERSLKRLLIVEDDQAQRLAIEELIGHDDLVITGVSSGKEALRELTEHHYDCMVLDLGLPDITGFDLLDQIRRNEELHDLPIIIYTGRELDKREEMMLKKYAETIIVKDVKSPERLLDETTLFLHRVEADLPEDKRNVLRMLHSVETIFEDRNVLIVDDDIRNVFALSNVLEGYKMNIIYAENGREAIEQIEKNPDLDLVLMDIMMPEMDGYEAMRHIRADNRFDKLPIIAVTAKAMKGDRDKCIEAGASDYIAKPVNVDQLLSLMRVWLYK
ncbi:response regulator [Paenibacillus pasadenensis]|uniref:response regulator n=1 Tax=Paenibacillus pasadenensis TaxID=217090 RepID=UPI00203F0E64|nr:response regulator [Paenibacillus pasadenensis]MCM3749098.1 response regulator [Paenibacillus pasadenensis]